MNFSQGIPGQEFNMNRACFPKEKHQNSQKWAKFMNLSFRPFLWFAGATPETNLTFFDRLSIGEKRAGSIRGGPKVIVVLALHVQGGVENLGLIELCACGSRTTALCTSLKCPMFVASPALQKTFVDFSLSLPGDVAVSGEVLVASASQETKYENSWEHSLSVPDVSRERRCLQTSPEPLTATKEKKDKNLYFRPREAREFLGTWDKNLETVKTQKFDISAVCLREDKNSRT